MPLSARNNLEELYAKQRLLQEAALGLEEEYDSLAPEVAADQRYILQVESRALWEEAARLGSQISDILERDLAR